MKKMLVLASMMVMTISAAALPFNQAQKEALFLSDKMAYELGLSAAQYEMIYEINLDYFLSVNNYNEVYGSWWARRNSDIRYILTTTQYNLFINLTYFYRPLSWINGSWHHPIYSKYTNHGLFYNTRPTIYVSYKGGNNRKGQDFYAHRSGNPGGNHGNNNNNNNNNHNYGNNNNNTNHNTFNNNQNYGNNNNHNSNSGNNNQNYGNNNNHNGNSGNNVTIGRNNNNSVTRNVTNTTKSANHAIAHR